MKYFFSFFLLLPFFCNAQNDTIYLDKLWNKTDLKHAYYSKICSKTDSVININDYLLRKKIELNDYYKFIDSDILDNKNGYYIFYDIHNHKRSQGKFINNKKDGLWKFYLLYSDNLKSEKTYSNGILNGLSIDYDSTTHKKIFYVNFKENKKDGIWKFFWNDTLYNLTNYRNGKQDGLSTQYYKNGKIKRLDSFANGRPISGHCYNENGNEIEYTTYILTYAEIMPYPNYNLEKQIGDNIFYPPAAKKAKINGRVVVKFVVNEDGSISDIKVLQGIGGGCDEEAIKVVAKMPPWVAGTQDGVARKVYYTLPLRFGSLNIRF